MGTEHAILRHTVLAAVAIGEHILCQLDGTLPAEGEYAYPAHMAAAAGERTAVTIFGRDQVVAGGAIGANAKIMANAAGKAVAHNGTHEAIGRALEAAAADGDVIDAFIFPN